MIDLQEKDLRLVLQAADEMGIPLPASALIFQLYRSLQTLGYGRDGNHALIKALEHLSGIEAGQVAGVGIGGVTHNAVLLGVDDFKIADGAHPA